MILSEYQSARFKRWLFGLPRREKYRHGGKRYPTRCIWLWRLIHG